MNNISYTNKEFVCRVNLGHSVSLLLLAFMVGTTYLGPEHRSMWLRSRIHYQPVMWPEFSLCSSQDASL